MRVGVVQRTVRIGIQFMKGGCYGFVSFQSSENWVNVKLTTFENPYIERLDVTHRRLRPFRKG